MGVFDRAACAFAFAFAVLGVPAEGIAEVKTIQVMGDEIRIPIPTGYCEPRGSYVSNAQVAAATDVQNATFLTLMRCEEMDAGGELSHFIYIKAPKSSLTQRVSLVALLEGLGTVPESELSAAVNDASISLGVSKNATEVLGRPVEIKTEIKPAAKDDYAYYLAGTVRLGIAGAHRATGAAVAFTSVKGHALTYNTYAPGDGLAAVREALDQAKREVRRLVEAN